MKREELMDAIGQLPEELIEGAAKKRMQKKLHWAPWAAVAACLCLLLSLPLAMGSMKAESKADGSLMETPMEAKPEPGDVANGSLYGESESGSARFLATVIEVNSWGLLVEPLEDAWERSSSDRIEVTFPDPEAAQEFTPGDLVRVTYSGMLQELYPARAVDVTAIERLG